jgi:hypothetical protein
MRVSRHGHPPNFLSGSFATLRGTRAAFAWSESFASDQMAAGSTFVGSPHRWEDTSLPDDTYKCVPATVASEPMR